MFYSFFAVSELSARGVIQQLFPLHEQRILSQLMKSWVQAVCEKQPLGQRNEIKHKHTQNHTTEGSSIVAPRITVATQGSLYPITATKMSYHHVS